MRNACVLAVVLGSTKVWAAPTKQECVAANESAQDLRRAGRLREAVARLAICSDDTCPQAVRDDCAQRITEVERATPTVSFDVRGRPVGTVRVAIDGRVVDVDANGIAVDPGEHRFAFDSGDAHLERTLTLREGEKNHREVVSFQSDHGPPVAAYVAFAAAGAGLLLGVSFTVAAIAEKDRCQPTSTPNACVDPRVDAASNRDVVTIDSVVAGIGYGITAIGAGAGVFLVLRSNSSSSRAWIAPAMRLGWFGLEGRFE